VRKQFVKMVEDLMTHDKRLVLLLGDIGVFGFRNAFKLDPERTYNIGVWGGLPGLRETQGAGVKLVGGQGVPLRAQCWPVGERFGNVSGGIRSAASMRCNFCLRSCLVKGTGESELCGRFAFQTTRNNEV